MEALDFAVRLRPVRAGVLRSNDEGLAGLASQCGSVGASVVGQDSFNSDTALCKPFDGAAQDTYCGDSGIIVVDFGVRDSGVVIEDRVNEGLAHPGAAQLILRLAGRRSSVPFTLPPTDVAPAAAVGDVPKLLHVDVHQRSGVRVLVAADRAHQSRGRYATTG